MDSRAPFPSIAYVLRVTHVAVCVAVMEGDGVPVTVPLTVDVGVSELVELTVPVALAVSLAVLVADGVAVLLMVTVGVDVSVLVPVSDGVCVWVPAGHKTGNRQRRSDEAMQQHVCSETSVYRWCKPSALTRLRDGVRRRLRLRAGDGGRDGRRGGVGRRPRAGGRDVARREVANTKLQDNARQRALHAGCRVNDVDLPLASHGTAAPRAPRRLVDGAPVRPAGDGRAVDVGRRVVVSEPE